MKNSILYILLVSILTCSCGDENLNDIAANQFVIEAFIYAGEPIDDIRVKSTFALSEVDDLSLPINDAEVVILKGGQRYMLVASGTDGYYHYAGDDLTVSTGDVFQLEVLYNGITAYGETVVPTPTMGLDLSIDSLKVPNLPLSMGRDAVVMAIQDFFSVSQVEATWENTDEDFYFMIVESVGDVIDPIFPQQVLDALETFRFVSEPTDGNAITFFGAALVSFGRYEVKVYHINNEYTALYENQEQDSRDLNEPPSNIENALGVFSAFNSQSAFFEVVRE